MIKQDNVSYIIRIDSDPYLYLTTPEFSKRNASDTIFRYSKNLAYRFYDIADALRKYRELVRENILTEYNLINNETHIIEEVNNSWFVIRVDKSNGKWRSGYWSDDKDHKLSIDVESAKKFYNKKAAENHLKKLLIEIFTLGKYDTEVIRDLESSEDSLDKLKEYCDEAFDLKFNICMYEYNIYRVIK